MLVPDSNPANAAQALAIVSWTRSSASWWLRVIRTAAGYSWLAYGTASSSNRAARSGLGLSIMKSCPENRTSTRTMGFRAGAFCRFAWRRWSGAGDGPPSLHHLLGPIGHLHGLGLRHP